MPYKNILLIVTCIVGAMCLHSCKIATIVRKYPANEPFVFKTTIKIEDNTINKEEKTRLETNLYEQLDDSVKARSIDKVIVAVMKNPALLDSSAISKSIQYMDYFLNSQGYFNDSIYFTTNIKPNEKQQRTYINFYVIPGKLTRIDSLSYTMRYDSLQAVVDNNLQKALIKKGSPFAIPPISSELDRLVEIYRNKGYLKFSRDLLYGLWDTLDISLLQPSIDPFEQAAQLEKLRLRRLNPTANLDIRLRPVTDTTRIMKYYVGNILVYPDVTADITGRKTQETTIGNVTVIQHYNKFKAKIFPPNIYLKKGDLYDQQKYIKTLNRLNNLGSWRLVDIQQNARENSNQDTVDFTVKLTPAKKYSFTTNLEGSFSQSYLSGNFFGTGINLGLQNRNFLRGANLATSNLRYGVELNLGSGNIIQTQQISLSNSIVYPRFIFPGMDKFKNNFRGTTRSILSLNAANTERRLLFNLTSFNTSWGYEFSWPAKDNLTTQRSYNLNVKLPNIEYSNLIKRKMLDSMITKNPALNNIFSDGLVVSSIFNFTMPWSKINGETTHIFRSNLESSGLFSGLIRNKFLDDELYRFVKVDAEYARLIKWTKTSLVLRGYAGIGYELDATRNPDKRSKLPFYKQFYSGGPNSMRAWQLRRLGPGSTVKFFKGELSVPDRFGDMQLEANIEYRMPIAKPAGIPVNGAIFTDIGNVWLLKKDAGMHDEVFSFSRLGTDLAIGSGAGLRVDFGFFVIRLDYAYKVKDPSPSPENYTYQNKFFAYPFFKGSQLQIGIGYPFIF